MIGRQQSEVAEQRVPISLYYFNIVEVYNMFEI